MEALRMSVTVFEHIKGSDLPKALRNKLEAKPDQTFTVTVVPEDKPKAEKSKDTIDWDDDPLFKAVGIMDSGRGDLAENHDHYLSGKGRTPNN